MSALLESSRLEASPDNVYEVGGVPVSFASAIPEILPLLKRILRYEKSGCAVADGPLRVSVIATEDRYNICVDELLVRRLVRTTPAPLVAQELILAACTTVARKIGATLFRGPIVEKDGVRLALVGDDIDAANVLAFHFHSRGWSILTFCYSLVDRATLVVSGLDTLASISSSSIGDIPTRYRSSIEASLWYDTGFDLMFYTVDAACPLSGSSEPMPLTHLIMVDGEIEDLPAIVGIDDLTQVSALGIEDRTPRFILGRLTQGTPIASCGAIERWVFASRNGSLSQVGL
jgi:hypothetical protein